MDHLQAIMKEVRALPPESLPRLHRFIKVLRSGKKADRARVREILKDAEELARKRKDWPQEKLFVHLFKVAENVRKEAVAKGVAIERDEDAAINS
jgi:hypothetical protein